ncbi:hypothetical protein [Thermoflexibacter ruber]|uniref:Uncharacterized protein n=1 Tax=Thermoflexibacter ruber TaxID=1003 RepID=A0A1I2EWK6_9BACT|nr:hypothetical protein [Thermoflexibacter ruber]SFE96711.1 hypothetical protein SAMN04488541_101159 [Thermoflexibacter ruber]
MNNLYISPFYKLYSSFWKRSIVVSIGLIVLFMQSCQPSSPKEREGSLQENDDKNTGIELPITSSENNITKGLEPIKVKHRLYNDFARLVAGLPLEEGSSLTRYTQSEAYKKMVVDLDKAWAKVDADRFAKMRSWAKTELSTANQDNALLFYPFSGPDFVNAYQFFPNAESYLLIGLETVMPFPDFRTFTAKMIDNYFISILESVDDLFEKSYFFTRRMSKDFQKGRTEGILPVLCLFIVRTGHTIADIEKLEINKQGEILASAIDTVNVKLKGVKISFFNPQDNQLKTVYYFRQDLSNNGLKQNPNFMKMLQNLPSCNTYFKSASYLLHYPYFTDLRPLILEKSKSILQDDTGVPFRFFDRAKWDLAVYGVYDKPIKDFKRMEQKDLKNFYDSLKSLGAVKPMPFDLGYHWGKKDNNLMRAIKKINK